MSEDQKLKILPLVSVVIPVFNADLFLRETIDCINNQTYDNYEIIFVEDGSTDKSVEIIENAMEKNPRIKLIFRNRLPKGAPTCRNIGLEKAKGKYLIYIDSDDLFTDFFLEHRVKYMEKNNECDYATFRGGTIYVEKDSYIIGNQIWGEKLSDDMLIDFLSTKYPFSIWNNIYRLEKFRKVFWDEKLEVYQDFDFAIKAIIGNYRHNFVWNEEVDYYYREGNVNTISSEYISEKKDESTKYLFKKTINYLDSFTNNKKYRKAFNNFFVLQFSRLIVNGTNKQQKEYIKYCGNYLNIKVTLKMKIVYLSNKYTRKIINSKVVSKFIIGISYYPKVTFSVVFNKIKRKV